MDWRWATHPRQENTTQAEAWTPSADNPAQIASVVRKVFRNTDAYRYNSASIRVRVIDPRFEGKSTEERDAMVEPLLKQLPENTQADIINLITLSPNETTASFKKFLANVEFEDPSDSML